MDFLSDFLSYTDDSEPPKIYYRWSAITGVAALLGRSCYIPFGSGRIFPNLYCMLIGDPGTRKSVPIKWMKNLMEESGYDTFAADKSSKEKFLMDLDGTHEEFGSDKVALRKGGDVTDDNLWGSIEVTSRDPKEVFVVADEFNEFAGTGNLDFYSTLGNLWDFDRPKSLYTERFKNSKSVSIYQPTVSILGGNTPENFARAFPPEIIGQGFLSRLLLIHGERTTKRITFPGIPSAGSTQDILRQLTTIRKAQRSGGVVIDPEAYEVLDAIYKTWQEIDDVRFKYYTGRRQIMHLKLCMIIAACRNSSIMRFTDIIEANTILTAAEAVMPKALGEFGRARNSAVANKIMEVLKVATKPIGIKDLWRHVMTDLDNMNKLQDLMSGLQMAGRVQTVTGGYLPLTVVKREAEFVDWSYLTPEEREGL